jgi:hypothetical protein
MAPEKLRQVTFPHHPRRYSIEDADELVISSETRIKAGSSGSRYSHDFDSFCGQRRT